MKAEIKKLLKRILFYGIYAVYYRLQCCRKMQKDSVLFLDIRFPELCDSFHLLKGAYEKRADKQVFVFCLGESRITRSAYFKRCFAMLKAMAVAELIFVDAGNSVISAVKLRKGSHLIQLWHGCGAFKRFGYEAGLNESYYGNTNLVTVSGKAVVDVYSRSMRIPQDRILPLGTSRTDVFFDVSFVEDAGKRIEELDPELRNKKVILYAPTFRGNGAAARMPELLDIEMLYEGLSEEYIILFKSHPAVREKAEIPEKYRDFFVDVSDTFAIEDLICRADVCITDYSSLIFEFSLFGRPMVFYAYDYEEYVTERGFYYAYEEFVPGPVCRNTEEVVAALKNMDQQEPGRVEAFRNRFMDGCDGRATERIMNAAEVLLKEND